MIVTVATGKCSFFLSSSPYLGTIDHWRGDANASTTSLHIYLLGSHNSLT